ncbi:lipoate--protein ligase family protein [Desulforamulus putei]|uniref:Lipoate-protein ligase A n=1 Tax=Desulforamulus putei DSM 12395 TaxID=1121429 RepID=A0A1M5CGC7_9FIRM|nr:biotin/lipoate A/B protein ligase family protein [Desulforamulus putei]SHF53779.1 lipoate-protein ligase A [Desulforamulus putei DSM 12395]
MNMAVDEAILICQSEGKVPPTIRFYQWNPPAITIGYFQKINQEVDLEACREAGIDCVRRLTGGRAVLHHRELTYSLVTTENDPHVPGGVLSSYLAISKGLLAGLRNLGLEGKVVEGASQRSKGTAACFDAPSWYEITIDGKKVIGSAQTRKHGSLLQHGSVPIILEAEEVCRYLRFPSPAIKEYAFRRLRDKAAGLAQLLGYVPPMPSIEKAFLAGFAEGLGIQPVVDELTVREKELARDLYINKYRQDTWNFKR